MKIEAELLERVKAATGPDRDLERDLVWLFYSRQEAGIHMEHCLAMHSYTASIDACVALVERELPGWQYLMGSCNEDGHPWACVTDKDNPYKDYAGTAPTIPFALIEALLLAKNAQP